jgi:hypothetical protein
MNTAYKLAIHIAVIFVTFNLSILILRKRPPRKGAISSLTASLTLFILGGLYLLLRSPLFLLESRTPVQNARIATFYLIGSALFALHVLYIESKKEKPNQPSQPIPLTRDG